MQTAVVTTHQIAIALRLASLEGDVLALIAKSALSDEPGALGLIYQSSALREVESIAMSGEPLSPLSLRIIRDIRSRLKAADKDWLLDHLVWQRVTEDTLPEGVLIVCNRRDGELVDINTAWYYHDIDRWLETGNDEAKLPKNRFGFFIMPDEFPPFDSSDWLEFDGVNPPAGLVFAAIDSYDCGWVYQMAYYRDGRWHHPCTGQDTRAHMPFSHYIPVGRLPKMPRWV